MDLQLKKATIVDADKNNLTVILLIKKKNRIERTITVDKKEMEDFWTSISISGKLYDVNFWHEESGKYRATLYPTRWSGNVLETVTNDFSGTVVKNIPLKEYRLIKK